MRAFMVESGEMKLSERCHVHALMMDDEGWYVTANVLDSAGVELDSLESLCEELGCPPDINRTDFLRLKLGLFHDTERETT
jgi:hypothetical protein